MCGPAADRVDLVILEDRRVRGLLARKRHVEDGVVAVCPVKTARKLTFGHRDRVRLLAAAVQNTRDEAFTAQPAAAVVPTDSRSCASSLTRSPATAANGSDPRRRPANCAARTTAFSAEDRRTVVGEDVHDRLREQARDRQNGHVVRLQGRVDRHRIGYDDPGQIGLAERLEPVLREQAVREVKAQTCLTLLLQGLGARR